MPCLKNTLNTLTQNVDPCEIKMVYIDKDLFHWADYKDHSYLKSELTNWSQLGKGGGVDQ